MLSFQGQLFVVTFRAFLISLIIWLLTVRKINEEHALLWFVILILLLLLSIRQDILLKITHLMGAIVPISVLTLLALSFTLSMLVYFSMKISVLSHQIKELVQYIAILDNAWRQERNNTKE